MKEDIDNVVDLATRRTVDRSSADVVHTVVCLGLQRELYELRIDHLKQTNRALLFLTLTAYIIGMYCGFIVASNLIYAT